MLCPKENKKESQVKEEEVRAVRYDWCFKKGQAWLFKL
jgi:hypothetical protein